MTNTDGSFQYDPNWPPKDNKKSNHACTKKEDLLIVDYLIETKSFERLSGNEVWKTMCRSRKFNPAGRSFQGLRERFRNHIMKRLHMYRRVTPEIKALILKQNPKALKNINAMKSTKELKRDLEKPWSSEDDEEAAAENISDNSSMTPFLQQRKRLVEGLTTKTMTSTPFISDPAQDAATKNDPAEGLENDNAPTSSHHPDISHLYSPVSNSPEKSADEDPLNNPDSFHLFSPVSDSPEKSADEDCLNNPHYETSMQLSNICPTILFDFGQLEAHEEHRQVSNLLHQLNESLKATLEAHAHEIPLKSFSCSRSQCDGTSTYFALFEELIAYLGKIDSYHLKFDACYLKFFARVVTEILKTPTCCELNVSQIKLPILKPEELNEYLNSDCAAPLRKNLESVQKLINVVRGRVE